jgi:hypothetical protein
MDQKDIVFEVLKEMAAKVGQSVEYMWPHVVSYERAKALAAMIASGAGLVFFTVMFIFLYWRFGTDKISYEPDRVTFRNIITFIYAVLFVTCIAIFCCNVGTYIEPEGSVINDLVNRVARR